MVLKGRGYRVATIKEMPNRESIDVPADSHDTWKHGEAGADIVVASPQNETVMFIKRKLGLNEIAPFLQDADYVVLEGFREAKILPKIIAAKTADEAVSFSDGLTIAISGILAESVTETKRVSSYRLQFLAAKPKQKRLLM